MPLGGGAQAVLGGEGSAKATMRLLQETATLVRVVSLHMHRIEVN